jgi:glycosyltransferase involved in cell wall biosynthesis
MGFCQDTSVLSKRCRAMSSLPERPRVTVCVITYNQVRYIRDCLQSIVDQRTSFPFEVLVADNGSNDGTTEIVREFAVRYPALLRPIIREAKISGSKNYVLVHDEARGDYVAHMDGDDLALPGKLQRQADELDSHPDCPGVWHRVNYFDDAGRFYSGRRIDISVFKNGVVELSDAIRLGFVGVHSSLMYRRSARQSKDADKDYLDLYLTWELLSSGPGRYIDDVLGEYRVGARGSISNNSYGLVRLLAVEHAEYFLNKLPGQRRNFVLFAIVNALIDIRRARTTALQFLAFAVRHFVPVSPFDIYRTLSEYRQMNVRWRRVQASAS